MTYWALELHGAIRRKMAAITGREQDNEPSGTGG